MFPLAVYTLMNFKNLKDIVEDLNLISGDESAELKGICDLEFPSKEHVLFIKNKKYLARTLEEKPQELAIILDEKLADSASELESLKPVFIASVKKIDLAVSHLSQPFYDKKFMDHQDDGGSISPNATICDGAFVGRNVTIGDNTVLHPGCVVMDNCTIGEGTILFPNTTVYPFCEIGNFVRVHAGSVIGADGFGYNHDQGVHHKVWHMGGVQIGDHVEVGANSQIDGGTFTPTIIGAGTKLDNNVQIGHNCQLGRGVIICGHVAIGGSSKLGDYTVFGGKSGMGDNMKLGAGCQVAGGALVNTDWPDGTVLGGHPARPLKEWMRGIAFVRKESLKK